MIEIMAYIIIGGMAGFIGGLLGVGGGLITVPSLLLIFYLLEISLTQEMQIAVGTSLAAMVFTSAASAWAHYKRGGVVRNLFLALAPGIILGAISGAFVADYLPSLLLKKVFGVCAILIGFYFMLTLSPKEDHQDRIPQISFSLFPLGIFIGCISSILGIGGGLLTVPILTALSTPLRKAIATSAATGVLIALFGAISFLLIGLKQQQMRGTLGYIDLPAFITIGIASVCTTFSGAKCAYTWPKSWLYRIFAVYLIGIGVSMLV